MRSTGPMAPETSMVIRGPSEDTTRTPSVWNLMGSTGVANHTSRVVGAFRRRPSTVSVRISRPSLMMATRSATR